MTSFARADFYFSLWQMYMYLKINYDNGSLIFNVFPVVILRIFQNRKIIIPIIAL